MPSRIKTKKNKDRVERARLWSLFDQEIKDYNKAPVECIYRNKEERESCDVCGTGTGLSDDGFYTCKNPSCGVLYTDTLDLSPEWRYYGADDSHTGNPTRCGMPVNPLMVESSFGCKVVCEGRSTYEMRKIRRYTEWQAMPYKDRSLTMNIRELLLWVLMQVFQR